MVSERTQSLDMFDPCDEVITPHALCLWIGLLVSHLVKAYKDMDQGFP